MQKMDRNTVIGFVLMAVLLFVYLYTSTQNANELQAKKQQYDDSIAKVQAAAKAKAAQPVQNVPVVTDSVGLQSGALAGEQSLVMENELVKVVLTSRGAQPLSVELKKYKSFSNQPVKLFDHKTDLISYSVKDGDKVVPCTDLYFKAGALQKDNDGKQTVTFTATGKNGEQIEHRFSLPANSYFVDMEIALQGTPQLLSNNQLNLLWQMQLRQQEKDVMYERQQSQLCFQDGNDYDYENLISSDDKKFEGKVKWVSARQQFFNATLISKDGLAGGQSDWVSPSADTVAEVALLKTHFNIPVSGNQLNLPLQFYFGPNDYKILRASEIDNLDKLVNLGQGFYAFVRPINQFIILPVFDFFKKFISSYGVVIMLLTIFIRVLTSPLVYSSYLSGAKMKALRPEIDQLRAKHGDDQQAFGMEQMKLFREAGVNPLGGCIPALLQIPIFFALYSFFNANVALRGESFLWAEDLSVYDAFIKFGVNIPLLGGHISLFTILAVVTSFLISLYGMANTPDQSNPALKYMPYIFPFMLLFIFNKLPSALTWYYTVSNVITLLLQFVIQKFIIDHDKIVAQLAENRKKPKSKSKWQERLEQMQESQKKLQDMQQKTKKGS
jgi:YidC/Oxa1 family membrane protein insertase